MSDSIEELGDGTTVLKEVRHYSGSKNLFYLPTDFVFTNPRLYSKIGFERRRESLEEFGIGSVPVNVAARVYGKDTSWIRAGIIAGWLPIGNATRDGQLVTKLEEMDSRLGRINYYISPKKLFEQTGYVWKGEKQ